jgi:c-di-GMP-binding flagellar brake protein YcgR
VSSEFQERRKTPRVAVQGQYEFRLGRRLRVRVVDISESGALLAADERLPVGTRGRLQVTLSGAQFEGQVHVKREQGLAGGDSHLIGLTVTPSQPRHQEALQQFLRKAGN